MNISGRRDIVEEVQMLFEDKEGNLMHPDEVDELSPWEIEERGLHVYDHGEQPISI